MIKSKQIEFDLILRNIQCSDRVKRQSALQQLYEIVQVETNDELKVILDQIYLHLLKCYSDRYESIRSLAIAIVSQVLMNIENYEHFFEEIIVPAIRKRIGLSEMLEPSEEIQLQLLKQIHEIVVKFRSNGKENSMCRLYNDVIDIVLRNLSNCFADAQRQCCGIIKELANATEQFHMKAEYLVEPLILMLKHRQSNSRILAIETLGKQ